MSGRRRTALAALLAAAMAVLVWWPSTDPTTIDLRARVVGARFVYGSLACCGPDFARWDVVAQGVRSGDPRWLRVAARLRPVIDAHPAEELYAAVATAFEANPPMAVELLIPEYGAAVVCGGEETEEHVDARRARARLTALQRVRGPLPEVESCRVVLKRIANGERVEDGVRAR